MCRQSTLYNVTADIVVNLLMVYINVAFVVNCAEVQENVFVVILDIYLL